MTWDPRSRKRLAPAGEHLAEVASMAAHRRKRRIREVEERMDGCQWVKNVRHCLLCEDFRTCGIIKDLSSAMAE